MLTVMRWSSRAVVTPQQRARIAALRLLYPGITKLYLDWREEDNVVYATTISYGNAWRPLDTFLSELGV